MKRRKNVDGSNNANTNNKTKLASPKADQCTVTVGRKNKVKKKAAVDVVLIEESNKERETCVGEASLFSSIPSLSIVGKSTDHISTTASGSSLEGWEENWDWSREGVVDEQMSWGSTWSPTWDVEYMGEACGEMFSDVMWDDDIWNLKSVDKVPNP